MKINPLKSKKGKGGLGGDNASKHTSDDLNKRVRETEK